MGNCPGALAWWKKAIAIPLPPGYNGGQRVSREVMGMNFKHMLAALQGVAAYKDLLDRPVLACALRLTHSAVHGDGLGGLEAYTDLFYQLQVAGCGGLGEWLGQALRWSEGPYPRLCEAGGRDPALEQAARMDVSTFALLASVDCDKWLARLGQLLDNDYQGVLTGLPRWRSGVPFSFEGLTQAYRREGAGLLARYRAFCWQGGQLIPVSHPDCPGQDDLLGYQRQRETIIRNTQALLAGKAVNNILLYGESGTGKSATVKSLLHLPGSEDLRLIQADKEDLSDLPSLIRTLEGRRQKFILFLDDLALDQDSTAYSALKTILEGGIAPRPDNVAVYATSNRRHLVRQSLSQRLGDEVDRAETIRETTSLADRFGLRVLFQGLDQGEFLSLVDQLAARHGVCLPSEQLHQKAVVWERYHGSQTPRSALQFVLSLT